MAPGVPLCRRGVSRTDGLDSGETAPTPGRASTCLTVPSFPVYAGMLLFLLEQTVERKDDVRQAQISERFGAEHREERREHAPSARSNPLGESRKSKRTYLF